LGGKIQFLIWSGALKPWPLFNQLFLLFCRLLVFRFLWLSLPFIFTTSFFSAFSATKVRLALRFGEFRFQAGWPDWAKIRPMGDCFLRTVFF
jgi:hypothetical protein